MPAQPIVIHIVTQRLDGEYALAEPLLMPAVQLCGDDGLALSGDVRRLAGEIAAELPPLDWHRHVMPRHPFVWRTSLRFDPPKKQRHWQDPIEWPFDVLWWEHGGDYVVGYVPALGVEVIAENIDRLDGILREQLRSAVRRTGVGDSLYRIALLQRVESTSLHSTELVVGMRTPRQRYADLAAEAEKAAKPLIEQVGEVLLSDPLKELAYEVDALVARIAESLAAQTPRSVLLVGPAGVGKTAAVRELARRRNSLRLPYRPFWATSGARLVAGMSGFGMWQERCTQLCKEAQKAQAVVHFGSLYELMEVGKAESIGQGVAGFLKPQLIRGDLLAVAECTAEQLTLIERTDPHLLDAFQIVRVTEPTPEAARTIIRRRAGVLCRSADGKAFLTESGLQTLDRLHRRYAGYSAYPSRPLRFTQNLIQDLLSRHPDGFGEVVRLGPAEVTTAFALQTGLPPFLLDDDIPLDVRQTQETFSRRVIGQSDAVELVANLIATVKAGLGRPRRPLASLLFIGPTGVGKTEMARTLAEFFFSSADRMTRFDMSEFATAIDVQRLVGGVLGSEGLLTAKVREHPFSVVLLDEVEKAHPLLFDLLLQVLGEGRLTDAAGRVADFTNAVVIMTSNLGAESFQRGGFGVREAKAGLDARMHFIEEVRAFLRPELFNRIDRIVPFLPLDEATVLRIVRRELDLVARRDGILLRDVAFNPGDDVVGYLATKGYDRIYGARPLKRLIERELLVPLADGINGYGDHQKLAAEVTLTPAGQMSVVVRAVADTADSQSVVATRWADSARAIGRLRRQAQQLHRTTALLGVENELFSLRRAEEQAVAAACRQRKTPPYDALLARRISRLSAVVEEANRIQKDVVALEDLTLDLVYSQGDGLESPGRIETERSAAERAFTELLASLFELRFDHPDRVTIALFGLKPARLGELARAYAWAAGESAHVKAWWFGRSREDVLEKHLATQPGAMLQAVPERAEGLLLSIDVPHALLRFSGETGMHVFQIGSNSDEVYVFATHVPPAEYLPPAPVANREPMPELRKRRQYKIDLAMAKDAEMSRELRWGGRGFREAVSEAMDYAREQALAALLNDEQETASE